MKVPPILLLILLLILLGIVFGLIGGKLAAFIGGNVALLRIEGEITPYPSLFELHAHPYQVIELLDSAERDASIKAILIEINSPGGSVVGVWELAEKIANLTKPVVCVIRELGVSGAYIVASACDWIIASPFSMIGNLGVSASYLEFSGLLEKLNISYVRIVAGEYKDIGTPFRKPTEEEIEMFKQMINEIHERMMKIVARNRKMSEEAVRGIAGGEIWLGGKALEKGLVDQIGGIEEAKGKIMELANLTQISFVELREEPGFLEWLFRLI